MIKIRFNFYVKYILTGILCTLLFTTITTGCGNDITTPETPEDYPDPFVTDRVVTIRIVMKEEDWNYCMENALEEEYVIADFWFDGELVPSVAVRPKGNSSLQYVVEDGSNRLSLKVDFNKIDSTQTFRGLKKLNFHNGFRDPTFLRERLAYELFAEMGLPAPRVSHVDLWVNNTHLGLYIQVEQVDKTFLKRYFDNNSGNLYKPIIPAAFLNWTDSSQLNRVRLKTNENKRDHRALLHFLDILNNEPDETFPGEIEKVLDVDETLRYIATAAVAGYLDSYIGLGHNYYLYEDNGKFTIIPWDPNEAFGTYKCGAGVNDVINLYIDEPVCPCLNERPLVERLLAYQPYLDRYHAYIREMLDGPFSIDVLEPRIDELADMIRPFVYGDELKFFSTSDFESNLTDELVDVMYPSYYEDVEDVPKFFATTEFERNLSYDVGRYIGLKSFITRRSESVRKQLAGELPSKGDGTGIADEEWQEKWRNP